MTDQNKLISERKNKFEKIKKHQNSYPNNFKKNISAVDILDLYKSKDKIELEKVDLSYAPFSTRSIKFPTVMGADFP